MRYISQHGHYELNPFPGSNTIVVSNSAFVKPEHRGNGAGSSDHKDRLEHIAQLGYDCVICTCIVGNNPQEKILTKNKWSKVHQFQSSKTNNIVGIWIRTIVL